MSTTETPARSLDTSPAGVTHYQALCGACLGAVFLAQLQQGLFLTNLLSITIGVWGLVSRMRAAPTLFLIFLAGSQLAHQISQMRVGLGQQSGAVEIADVVLCAGVLGFIVSQYRLQAIWGNILPLDPRQRAGEPRLHFPWLWRIRPIRPDKRTAHVISPSETAWLVISLPIWALVAQIVWALLPDRPDVVGLPPRLSQMILIAWILALGAFAVATLLRLTRHRRRSREQALLYLQDTVWRETRGEQRRLGRWLAWGRRRRQADQCS